MLHSSFWILLVCLSVSALAAKKVKLKKDKVSPFERPPRPTYPPPQGDNCQYTFTIQGHQLQQHCQISEVQNIVSAVKSEYDKIVAENADLKAQIESIRKDYEGMVETVKKLDKETSTWREVIEWPTQDTRFQPENSTLLVKPGPSFVDCNQAYAKGNQKKGIYNIKPQGTGEPFLGYCDDEGWTVIQRRFDGSVDFNNDWTAYSAGFGQLSGEFWLGNEHIHQLTSQDTYDLRVEFLGWNGKLYHTVYEEFSIGTEEEEYKLIVGNVTDGNYRDVLTDLNEVGFSTKDHDNDEWYSANCADYYTGAWYLKNCGYDPNRMWCEGTGCMQWGDVNIKKSVLKIKPGKAVSKSTREGIITKKPGKPVKPKKQKKSKKPKKPKNPY